MDILSTGYDHVSTVEMDNQEETASHRRKLWADRWPFLGPKGVISGVEFTRLCS